MEQKKNKIWHPFTQMKNFHAIKAVSAKDEFIYTQLSPNSPSKNTALPTAIQPQLSGIQPILPQNCLIDLISSWWVTIHGHSNPEIAEAIYQQAKTLEHVIFANFTHTPANKICENLSTVLDKSLNKYFFSDNGSCAVEIALKIAYQYHVNKSQDTDKTVFLKFKNAYHGDTFGAMSVGDSKYHKLFENFFFKTYVIDFVEYNFENEHNLQTELQTRNKINYPNINNENKQKNIQYLKNIQNIEILENTAIKNLKQFLNENHKSVCALIIEPIVQGSSGMRMCRPEYIDKIVNTVKKYDIITIFDEIFTGFYRTGKFFAYEHTNVIPDIICLSKALTGGFLPMALTITNEEIFEKFYEGDKKSNETDNKINRMDNKIDVNNNNDNVNNNNNNNIKNDENLIFKKNKINTKNQQEFPKTFLHGHSFTANPIACAAANKSFEILSRKNTIDAINNIIKLQNEFAVSLLSLQNECSNIRHIGVITAFSVQNFKKAKILCEMVLQKGVFLRPLEKHIYLIPPYCIDEKILKYAHNVIIECLKTIN